MAFEFGEFGEGVDAVGTEAVEVGAAVGNEVDARGRDAGDSGADLVDVVLSLSDLFGGLRTEEVVVPLTAGDLIDGSVAETGIVFEGGFVFGGESGADKLGISGAEGI